MNTVAFRLAGSALFALIPLVALAWAASGRVAAEQPASNAGRLEIGESFANLTLPSLDDGRPRSLADFRGQKVILHIFASW